tara:strand:+ start:376 stop:801 length:426 start_codon:yes stop_codon:yes gene_type:complete
MAGGITMAFIRKACIAVLFIWFCFALIVNVFGLPFYFPSNIAPSNEIMLYRGETTRVASASLLALLVFRYLFELKALPSLSVVLYYGVFFVIGGMILGIRDNIEVEDMYFLGGIVFLCGLIKLELMQKKKEESGKFKRDYF